MITQKLLKSCEDAIVERFDAALFYQEADKDAFLAEHGARYTAIAGGGVSATLMDQLPNLGMISNFGVGYDSIDTDAARARDIRVTNTPNVLNDAMAELTLGMMISLSRRIPQADQFIRQGKWPSMAFPLQSELTGKTVGIVGLGRIGKEIAERCQAMKMRVVYFGRHKQPSVPFIYYDDLIEMARDADWLVVMTPGGPETEKLVNTKVMSALGEHGYLVNMSRGTVVDEAAMVEALVNKKLAGAALDVFEHEPEVPSALLTLDNVVLSPHQGSATHQTRYAMGALVVENLAAYFNGDPLLSPVV